MKNNTFHILDISAVAHHCLHSGKEADQITLSSGRVVNTPMHAIQAFTQRYLPLLRPMGRVIVVKDAGRTFRNGVVANNAIAKEYKGGRESDPEMREISHAAIKGVSDLLLHLGANICHLPGEEADDVIAYLCRNLPGYKIVYTMDKDLVALAANDVAVYLKLEDTELFQDKGVVVHPKYTALFKSLVGDSSDNYGGVSQFGHGAWSKMVEAYHDTGIFTLDNLLAIADNFENLGLRDQEWAGDKPGVAEYSILQNLAKTDKGLAKIYNNILGQGKVIDDPDGFEPYYQEIEGPWLTQYTLAKLHDGLVGEKTLSGYNQLIWDKKIPSREGVEGVLKNLRGGYIEFADSFDRYYPQQHLVKASNIKPDTLSKLTQAFKGSRIIALDWETHSPKNEDFEKAARGKYVDARGAKISGMGITYGQELNKTMYFQFDHSDEENNISKDFLMQVLQLKPDTVPVVIHNCSFENTVLLSEFGTQFEGMYDTLIMHSHVDEMASSKLKDLSMHYFGYRQDTYDETIAKGKTMKDYTGQHVFKYGADDPLVTAHLFDLFYIILNLEGTWEFVRDYEFPTVNLLADAHVKGVSIDWELVEKQKGEDEQLALDKLEEVRQLFRENQDPTEHFKSAEVWYDSELVEALKPGNYTLTLPIVPEMFDQPALKFIKDIAGTVDAFFEDFHEPTKTEFLTFYAREVKFKRTKDIKKLAATYMYEDWVETSKDTTFSFIGSKVNLMANKLEIGVLKTSSNTWEEYLTQLMPIAKTVEQLAFVEDVSEAIKGNKLGLSARYKGMGIVKVTGSGTEFNLNSPPQNQLLFYGMLGLKVRVRNYENSVTRAKQGYTKGAPQANETALQEALAWGDVVGWKATVLKTLLEAKKATTRVNLFYVKFPMWKHPLDGMIHPQFKSTGTESRRPSGSSPNMLQLPKKDEGLKVRAIILPNQAMGHDLVCSADWSGEELRIIAGLSQDPNLLSCYIGDDLRDIHAMVAAEIAGCSYEEFQRNRRSPDEKIAKKFDGIRKSAKSVVFGGNYGIGAAKLSQQLHITEKEAKSFLDAKKTTYSGMEAWKEVVKQDLVDKGFLATNYGSRKHLFGKLGNTELVEYYKRSAVNFLVQGLAADYLKVVLATLWTRRTFQRHNALFYFGIYDELVWGCHSSQAISLTREVHEVMSMGIKGLDVPMLSTPAVGVNFANQIEVLKDENQILTDELIQIAIDKALKA